MVLISDAMAELYVVTHWARPTFSWQETSPCTALHIQIKWQEEPQGTSLHIGHLLDTALSTTQWVVGRNIFKQELYLLA